MNIDNSRSSHWVYQSSQSHLSVVDGKKTVTTEIVKANNKSGTKTVKKNGKVKTIPLTQDEIQNIKDRKFMPDFFLPCYDCINSSSKGKSKSKSKSKSKTKRIKKSF